MTDLLEQTTTATNGHGHAPDQWKDVIAGLDLPETVKNSMLQAGVLTLRQELSELPPDEREPIFERFSVSEVLKRPDKEWLIDKFIGKGDIIVCFGDAESGKTFATLDLMFSAALGQTFANQFAIPKPLKVAYCAGEGHGGLKSRFAAWLNHHGATTPEKQRLLDENVSTYFTVPQLFLPDVPETVYQFVSEWKAAGRGHLDLLAVDTYHSAIVGGDEDKSKDTGIILEAVKHTIAELGCTFYLAHHENKSGGYRGSTALRGAADTMIQTKILDKTSSIRIAECFKQKDAEKFKPLYFRLTPEPTSQSVYPEWLEAHTVQLEAEAPKRDQIKKEIVALLQSKPGLNQSQIVETLTDAGRKTILAALKELEDSGMVEVGDGPNNSKIYQLRMAVP